MRESSEGARVLRLRAPDFARHQRNARKLDRHLLSPVYRTERILTRKLGWISVLFKSRALSQV